MINAAIVGLGRWGRNLVRAVQGRSDRLNFTHCVVRRAEPASEFAAAHGLSVATHLVGKQIKAMFDDVDRGNYAEAAERHRKMLPLVNGLFVITSPIPVKFMLNEVGFRVGPTRLPLTEPDEATARKLREILSQYQIDLPKLVA